MPPLPSSLLAQSTASSCPLWHPTMPSTQSSPKMRARRSWPTRGQIRPQRSPGHCRVKNPSGESLPRALAEAKSLWSRRTNSLTSLAGCPSRSLTPPRASVAKAWSEAAIWESSSTSPPMRLERPGRPSSSASSLPLEVFCLGMSASED